MNPAIRKDGVAVITGAAVGIGFAIARQLACDEMQLVLLDRDANALALASARLKAEFPKVIQRTIVGNIADSSTINCAHEAATELGDVALLVNNAAIMIGGGTPWEQPEIWRSVMEINFWSVLAMQQRFVDTMIGQTTPGAIVNIGSKEGITTPPGNAAYNVSKGAVRILTEQLSHELRERVQGRITAHLLIPGYTFTPMNFPGSTFDTPKPAAPWSADQVAERLIDGMATGSFYIFCEDNEVTREIDQRRMQWSIDDLIHDRPALSRWHPAWRAKFAEFLNGSPFTEQ